MRSVTNRSIAMLASRTRGIRAAQIGRGHDYGVLRGVIAVSGVMVFLTLGVLAIAAGQGPLVPPIIAGVLVFVALLRDPTMLDGTVEPSVRDRRRSKRSAITGAVVFGSGAAAVAVALVADLDLLLFIAVFVCLLGLFFGVDAVDRQIPSELRRSPLGFYRRPHAH